MLAGDLGHFPRIRFQKTLKYGIVGDQVGVHLQQVLFIEFQSGIPFLDGVSHLIIAFNKLPKLVAGTVIRILHHQVGTLDGASHLGTAVHNVTERAAP